MDQQQMRRYAHRDYNARQHARQNVMAHATANDPVWDRVEQMERDRLLVAQAEAEIMERSHRQRLAAVQAATAPQAVTQPQATEQQRWDDALRFQRSKGLTGTAAIKAVDERHPGLRQKMIQEVNHRGN